MAGPALLFFVPLAHAGGKVFFKFATKKAAQAFKSRFAKAGNVTTRTPAKNANVTTTGSSKGQSIIKDMTKPVTQPRISPRNPNTTTLPKPPNKGNAAAAAAATAATGVGVAGSATSTGNAEKPKSKRKVPDRSADTVSRQQSQYAKRGGMNANKSNAATKNKRKPTGMSDRKSAAATKTKASPESAKSKSWKDYKSVSAAQKAGSDYFMGRDGKKKIAVTKEQLGNKSLTEYANKLKKKGK